MKSFVWIHKTWVLTLTLVLIEAACTTPKNTLLSKNAPLSDAQIETSHVKPLDTLAKATIQASYSKLPLSFESNQGQTDSQVHFLSRGSGYTLFLTPTDAVLSLRQQAAGRKQQAEESLDAGLRTPDAGLTVRMQLVGANPNLRVEGLEELSGKVNYFLGNDPAKWRTNVPTYAKVKYQNVYPGVDLIYYGNQRQLEYDFVVAPGADPNVIRLAFTGVVGATGRSPLQIDANGDLLMQTAGGEVRFLQPRIYQEIDGIKQPISGRYVLLSSPLTTESIESPLPVGEGQGEGAHRVGFEVATYDTSKPLIIDPVLSYSTYLGGSGNEADTHIAVDTSGNAYLMGYTNSVNFPITPGAPQSTFGGGSYDAFVSKLDPTGSTLLYSTYLGGSSREIAAGVAVDLSGNAYVTGYTSSTNFPTLNPLQAANGGSEDVFLAKLNSAGSLVYSTYLGGSAEDSTVAIAVDISDNAYITGVTQSNDFPTANPLQAVNHGGSGSIGDVFVTKVNAAGSALVYSTYLGGSAREVGQGLAVDSSGNVYVTGYTQSGDFPTANPRQAAHAGGTYDAFVAKIDPSQSPTNQLVYSTYLGGSNADQGLGITVDIAGNAYVTGNTQGDFPTTANPLQADQGGNDAFVTKIDPSQLPTNQLVYSTYLGGSGDDVGVGIAVDSLGNAYVAGQTSSSDFPTVNPLQAVYGGGDFDAFVVKLDASGSAFVYSTYLGSGGFDGSRGIGRDSFGNVYVAGVTTSTNFPTTPGAYDTTHNGDFDVFVAKICDSSSTQEVCNGIDDDCDGEIDEGFDVETACSAGVGACQRDGQKICTADGLGTECNATPEAPTTELCGDGIDNDCDSQTDEGFDVGAACSAGVGACQRDGNKICTPDKLSTQCNATPGAPTTELCNGLDDDCDGAVDDTPIDVGRGCSTGVPGVCEAGVTACSTGVLHCVQTILPSPETCNGSDDDCDGAVDENVIVASAGGPYPVTEGGSVGVTASVSTPVLCGLTFDWDLDNNGSFETPGQSVTFSAVGLDGPSNRTIRVRVTDGPNSAIAQTTVNVANVPPVVGPITAPIDPVQVNTSLTTSATFTDLGTPDTHTALWDWDDGTTSTGTVVETNGSGSVSGSHAYTTAGVYTVTLTVTDDDHDSGESVFQFVVSYDPNAGFVTGGGWITSPPGAYVPALALTGKATFGFVSKYQKGATVPIGQTGFQFKVANLNFHSTSYQWLVVAGPHAQYKGSGTINGSGDYGFLLTARDGQASGGGGVDKFRIKIWDKTNNDGLVYDNQMNDSDDAEATTALGGGSIVIHKQ